MYVTRRFFLASATLFVLVFTSGCGTPCPGSRKSESLSVKRLADLKEQISKLSPEGIGQLARKLNFSSKVVPKQLFIKFKDNTSQAKVTEILGTTGSQVLYQFKTNSALLINVPSALTDKDLIAIAAALSEVESVSYVNPNAIVKAVSIPNDPSFSQQEDLSNSGQNGGRAGADIRAPEAWDITTGSRSVLVGVIDSGIDYNHPDLTANIWTNPGESGSDSAGRDKSTNGIDDDANGFVDDVRGWDFVNNDNDPMDDNSHGTHVAGTIGAVGNNAAGISGINWQVSLVPLKFIDGTGTGSVADAVKAVEYANAMNIPITNNSWGGGGFDPTLEAAIQAAEKKGFLFVAAAGNDGSDNDNNPSYPASYNSPNVISVAAVDSSDSLASFSNFGVNSVHLAAPGVNVLSTIPVSQGSYARLSGTSMASPHVAGAAALVKSHFPQSGYFEIKARLIGGADTVDSLLRKVSSGGRLNLPRAMETDTVKPSAVTGLKISFIGITQLALSWNGSGDDGSAGRASHYQARLSTLPIRTEEDWERARVVPLTITGMEITGCNPLLGTCDNLPVLVSGMIQSLALKTKGHVTLRAFDNVGNMGGLSDSLSFELAPPQEIFSSDGEDFKGAVSEPEGVWGQETVDARGKVFSDSAGKNYDNNVNAALVLPAVKVLYPDLVLSLATRISCDAGFDWAYIEFQRNNDPWKELISYSAANCQWANLSFQLGDKVAAGDELKIRFRFSSNDSVSGEGWLLDDIKLMGVVPPAIPTQIVGRNQWSPNPAILSWLDNSTDETQFEVWRLRPNPGAQSTFDFILQTHRDVPRAIWSGATLPEGLRVRACNGPLCSDFSSDIQVLPPPPEISSIAPSFLSTAVSSTLTIKGRGFTKSMKVLIGELECSNLSGSTTQVSCKAPAQGQNTYPVRMINASSAPGVAGLKTPVVAYVAPRWIQTNGVSCNTVCANNRGMKNMPSPEGALCTSGELIPQSALTARISYPYGCWPNKGCKVAQGQIRNGHSQGPNCYGATQKRDRDRSDITVGCYCSY